MIEFAPFAGERQYCQGFAGDTFNTAVYLARADHKVQYLSRLGDDALSKDLLAKMQLEGMDTSLIGVDSGRLPGLYMISNDESGERSFIYWRDNSPAREMFYSVPAFLEPPDFFYFSGITLAVTRDDLGNLLKTLELVRCAGGQVVFDPNYRSQLWGDRSVAQGYYQSVLPLCDVVLSTQEDDASLWDVDDPEASEAFYRAHGASEIVVKARDLAAHVWRGDEQFTRRVKPLEAVDTTGAGDAFNAGYLAARVWGESVEFAIGQAQALAAKVVQHRGAIIPHTA